MYTILQKTAFLVPFTIGVIITCVMLWYARVRNPVKRYRPPMLQLLLAGIVLLMISGGVAAFIAKAILTGDEVVKELAAEERRSYEKSGSAGPAVGPKPETERKLGSWDRLKYGDPEKSEEDAIPPEE